MLKHKYPTLLLTLWLAAAAFGHPGETDLAGDWHAEIKGPQDTVVYSFRFDVKGDSFTGTVKIKNKKEEAAGEISDGRIDGDKIAFTVHIPIAGTAGTASAKGAVAGDQMNLTIEGEDPHDGHRKLSLTLNRANSN